MEDKYFDYMCPYCGTRYVGVHDMNKEKCMNIIICDECGKKYRLTSRAIINIEATVEKMK